MIAHLILECIYVRLFWIDVEKNTGKKGRHGPAKWPPHAGFTKFKGTLTWHSLGVGLKDANPTVKSQADEHPAEDTAQQDVDSIKNQASIQIEQERVAMLRSVEKQIIEVSSLMVDKVLDGYTFDENQMVQALEKEFKNSHAQSWILRSCLLSS